MRYTKKKGESGKIFVSQNIEQSTGRGIRKKGILHPSTIFQNTRILESGKIFVSYHNGRERSIQKKKGWKVEKFSYHKVYNEVEDKVYEKKGLGKWTNFRITKYIVR